MDNFQKELAKIYLKLIFNAILKIILMIVVIRILLIIATKLCQN